MRINGINSPKIYLKFGVPQGSVLGPILFTLYMAPVSDFSNTQGVQHMFYSDDSQIYVIFDAQQIARQALNSLEHCILDIKHWMLVNMLMLNDSKTEVVIC